MVLEATEQGAEMRLRHDEELAFQKKKTREFEHAHVEVRESLKLNVIRNYVSFPCRQQSCHNCHTDDAGARHSVQGVREAAGQSVTIDANLRAAGTASCPKARAQAIDRCRIFMLLKCACPPAGPVRARGR